MSKEKLCDNHLKRLSIDSMGADQNTSLLGIQSELRSERVGTKDHPLTEHTRWNVFGNGDERTSAQEPFRSSDVAVGPLTGKRPEIKVPVPGGQFEQLQCRRKC